MRLAIELGGIRIGTLEGDRRTFDFSAAPEGMRHFGANSPALSVSIPLTPIPRRDRAALRRNWFSELLPEGDQYRYMLAQAGLRMGDTLGFLGRYGRDVAGALQIWDLDDPTEPREPVLRPLNEPQVRALLADPINAPLANDPLAGKSSLGGVQPKIVLVKTDQGWAQSLGGYPTTHIVKPQLDGVFSSIIFEEEYGARIAKGLGLADHSTELLSIDGLNTLVIERYDRTDGQRIHQEDFNQVLGASGNQKYQRLGGSVTWVRVAGVMQDRDLTGEVRKLARMVTVSTALGNLDMHAKNVSLLHEGDGLVRLAPAYDMVPQAHLPNDGEVALAVAGEYRHAAITRAHLISEIEGWGVHDAEKVVNEALDEVTFTVASENPVEGAFSDLQDLILTFTRNLQEGRPIGRVGTDKQ